MRPERRGRKAMVVATVGALVLVWSCTPAPRPRSDPRLSRGRLRTNLFDGQRSSSRGRAISPNVQSASSTMERGICSYTSKERQGMRMASGEVYDMSQMTAAHPTLPFGTVVRVTNLNNGVSVNVEIRDRGPFKQGRIIDVSYAAARELGMVREGLVPSTVEVTDRAGERLERVQTSHQKKDWVDKARGELERLIDRLLSKD